MPSPIATPNPGHSPKHPVHGYLLAGGQSSRMGADKALLPLCGRTLLDRAAASLAAVCDDVTVVGRPHPTLRHIPDSATEIGPVGGVTAALRDLAARNLPWAFFLPVDVPLLPVGLLQALITFWLSRPRTRVAFPLVRQPQPIISLVHVSALPAFDRALATQQHRLRLVLEAAAASPVSLAITQLAFRSGAVLADGQLLPWQPDAAECHLQPLWFSNCNTPADLAQLEAALTKLPGHPADHP